MTSNNIRRLLAVVSCVAMTSAASAKTYNCQLSAPMALNREGGAITLNKINFPQLEKETWNFEVQIKVGKKDEPDTALVKWPTNPIQIAGEYPILPTAKGAIAFTGVGFDGCMFTVNACLATVQIADQESGKAKISVLPTALWTDDTGNRSEPFVAVIDGTCSWNDR
jgi:hypothetical protein